MAKMGPPTKASKGERKSVQITITLPADMNDQVKVLMNRLNLGRSGVIQLLLEKALRERV